MKPATAAGPTPDWHWRDPSTWAAVLAALGAFVTVLWPGTDLSPWIPAASIIAAGFVTAAVAISKHHLGAGALQAAAAVTAATIAIPASAPAAVTQLEQPVEQAAAVVTGLVTAASTPPPPTIVPPPVP